MEEDSKDWSFAQPAALIIEGAAVPLDFPYLCILIQGRPRHDHDAFSDRHPPMERGKRAKIFAPFDALDGYGESLATKRVSYSDQVVLDESEKEELNRRLTILHNLTFNSRMAKQNRVLVTVSYYVPCADKNNEAFEHRGQYVTVSGMVWNVDMEVSKTILVGETRVHFDSILQILACNEELFKGCEWD